MIKRRYSLILLLMMIPAFGLLVWLGTATPTASAQTACSVDVQAIMTEVQQLCNGLNRNQVCYGKVEVEAIPSDSALPLRFEQPGDSANVSQVRSLYLSAFDQAADIWGIAQMRILANTTAYPTDVNLLLFGDVSVETVDQTRPTLQIAVTSPTRVNIRSTPTLNGFVVAAAEPGETLRALGRLADGSWIRVEENGLGRVGWIAAALVSAVDTPIEQLAIDDGTTPYLGAMQAFYFESGQSPNCEALVSDGLLIQTPDGVARVTILINEVSIELVGSQQSGATAFIQSNSAAGMNLNLMRGSANVTAQNVTVALNANMTTNIPIDESNRAIGVPSQPRAADTDLMRRVELAPLTDFPEVETAPSIQPPPQNNNTGPRNGNSNGRGNGRGNGNGNANGNGNGNANGNGNGNANGNGNGNGNANGNGGGDDDDDDGDD